MLVEAFRRTLGRQESSSSPNLGNRNQIDRFDVSFFDSLLPHLSSHLPEPPEQGESEQFGPEARGRRRTHATALHRAGDDGVSRKTAALAPLCVYHHLHSAPRSSERSRPRPDALHRRTRAAVRRSPCHGHAWTPTPLFSTTAPQLVPSPRRLRVRMRHIASARF